MSGPTPPVPRGIYHGPRGAQDVGILQTRGEHTRCILPDGRALWVSTSLIEPGPRDASPNSIGPLAASGQDPARAVKPVAVLSPGSMVVHLGFGVSGFLVTSLVLALAWDSGVFEEAPLAPRASDVVAQTKPPAPAAPAGAEPLAATPTPDTIQRLLDELRGLRQQQEERARSDEEDILRMRIEDLESARRSEEWRDVEIAKAQEHLEIGRESAAMARRDLANKLEQAREDQERLRREHEEAAKEQNEVALERARRAAQAACLRRGSTGPECVDLGPPRPIPVQP